MYYTVSFFFFVKQKAAYVMRISEWSSDGCSSDLSLSIRTKGSIGITPSQKSSRRHVGLAIGVCHVAHLVFIAIALRKRQHIDRKSAVQGQSVYVRLYFGACRFSTKNKHSHVLERTISIE